MQQTAARPVLRPPPCFMFGGSLLHFHAGLRFRTARTMAPVHYVCIAEATRRNNDRSDVADFTR